MNIQTIKYSLLIILFINLNILNAQGSYAPNASSFGTTAIHKDSSLFVNWATSCTISRGWQNILDTTLGKASAGNQNNATGYPGTNGVVSLGDKGEAILKFNHPIINGLGNDFAVFENAFNDSFLELAYVEVSSNGIDFVRFPNYSETQDSIQVNTFDELDATNLYNLAGKYKIGFGTPFDLEELIDSTTIDINNINFVKIIDVVGIINNSNTSLDHTQNQINDPFPTPYSTSGFDLDAVGVIHQFVSIKKESHATQKIYPNPSTGTFIISYNSFEEKRINVLESSGKLIKTIITNKESYSFNEKLNPGLYFIKSKVNNLSLINKIIIQ